MKTKASLANFVKNNIIIVALVAAILVLSLTAQGFFTMNNLTNIMLQISTYGIVAFAMTISIIGGEFDLSVSSLMGFTTLLFTDIAKKSGVFPAILLCLAVGLVVGLLNGLMVSRLKMDAFVVTLGMMMFIKGLALTYTDGRPNNFPNEALNAFANGSFLGIPTITWFFLATFLIVDILLRHTRFGRNVYATGGNVQVAQMAGINVAFYKMMLFVILGLCTSISGVLMSMRLSAGNALYGSDLTMSVIAGIVIGGTSMAGGSGSAVRTFWGTLFIGVLFNGLQRLEIQASWQNVIKGAILVAVIATDCLMAQRKTRKVIVRS
ncbi:MAG: ABC transporter permease [Candidatus Excrementavichristensenella sp.]|jgi:ribose transport system permease protein